MWISDIWLALGLAEHMYLKVSLTPEACRAEFEQGLPPYVNFSFKLRLICSYNSYLVWIASKLMGECTFILKSYLFQQFILSGLFHNPVRL